MLFAFQFNHRLVAHIFGINTNHRLIPINSSREEKKVYKLKSPIKLLLPECNFVLAEPRFHFLDQTVCFQINQHKIIVLNKSQLHSLREFIKIVVVYFILAFRRMKFLLDVAVINKFTNYCNIARNNDKDSFLRFCLFLIFVNFASRAFHAVYDALLLMMINILLMLIWISSVSAFTSLYRIICSPILPTFNPRGPTSIDCF